MYLNHHFFVDLIGGGLFAVFSYLVASVIISTMEMKCPWIFAKLKKDNSTYELLEMKIIEEKNEQYFPTFEKNGDSDNVQIITPSRIE